MTSGRKPFISVDIYVGKGVALVPFWIRDIYYHHYVSEPVARVTLQEELLTRTVEDVKARIEAAPLAPGTDEEWHRLVGQGKNLMPRAAKLRSEKAFNLQYLAYGISWNLEHIDFVTSHLDKQNRGLWDPPVQYPLGTPTVELVRVLIEHATARGHGVPSTE